MVLDLARSRAYFAFAPDKHLPFVKGKGDFACAQTTSSASSLPHVVGGNLSPGQKGRLNKLILQYPDVLTAKLGLTHLLQYEIQLLEDTPVRLAPYRLAAPKMQYLREHVNKLLREGVIEPPSSH
jgi:hypothetical protein